MSDEFAHVMGNFLFGLHGGDVDLFKHEGKARETGLSFSAVGRNVVFLRHLIQI